MPLGGPALVHRPAVGNAGEVSALGDELYVRHAAPADVNAIGQVHAASWSRAYVDLFDPGFLGQAVRERRTRWSRNYLEQLTLDGSVVLVAVLSGHVVGFAHVGVDAADSRVGELFGFYVDPASWGSGAAVEVHRAAIAEWERRGLGTAHLWTHEGAARARLFYEHSGWRSSGAIEGHDFGDGRDSVLIEYVLTVLQPDRA